MRLFNQVEVGPEAILLVLLLESLEITEVRMDEHEDLEQTGRLRRPPPLLSADDLVATGEARCGFHLQQRLVAAGLDRAGELVDKVDGHIHARLYRTGLDQVDRNQREARGKVRSFDHAASPPG
jgi:hypothetical protein